MQAILRQNSTAWGALGTSIQLSVRSFACLFDDFATTFVVKKVIGWLSFSASGGFSAARKFSAAVQIHEDEYVAAAKARYENSIRLMIAAAAIYKFKIAFFMSPLLGSGEKLLSEDERYFSS